MDGTQWEGLPDGAGASTSHASVMALRSMSLQHCLSTKAGLPFLAKGSSMTIPGWKHGINPEQMKRNSEGRTKVMVVVTAQEKESSHRTP